MEYEAKLERDERELLFGSRMDRMEWKLENRKTTQELYQIFCGTNNNNSMEDRVCKSWSVAKETYGFATTVYGVCAKKHRSHVYRVEADLIGGGGSGSNFMGIVKLSFTLLIISWLRRYKRWAMEIRTWRR